VGWRCSCDVRVSCLCCLGPVFTQTPTQFKSRVALYPMVNTDAFGNPTAVAFTTGNRPLLKGVLLPFSYVSFLLVLTSRSLSPSFLSLSLSLSLSLAPTRSSVSLLSPLHSCHSNLFCFQLDERTPSFLRILCPRSAIPPGTGGGGPGTTPALTRI